MRDDDAGPVEPRIWHWLELDECIETESPCVWSVVDSVGRYGPMTYTAARRFADLLWSQHHVYAVLVDPAGRPRWDWPPV